MAASRVLKAALNYSSPVISWKSTGLLQQTISTCIERTGLGLHSGKESRVRICPELAGEGRYFAIGSNRIDASINFSKESPLCTTLCKDGYSVRTIEHLLSALEACGVDNCRIEVENSASNDRSVEAPAIGCQWFSCSFSSDNFVYAEQIASSRTFCIYEQVEQMLQSGLIQGGSLESAIVCSESKGWLNPPLHYPDEPCRHKVLDLIGDLSLFARAGSQGFPVAHIVAYKGGHALHTDFVRYLSRMD